MLQLNIYRILKWIKTVSDNSCVIGMREGIGIWSEILIAYLNSWNTLQKYSGISYIEDYPGYLALGVWCKKSQ